MSEERELILNLYREASKEVQQVVAEIIRLEKEKVHMKNPIGIADDIASIIRLHVK